VFGKKKVAPRASIGLIIGSFSSRG